LYNNIFKKLLKFVVINVLNATLKKNYNSTLKSQFIMIELIIDQPIMGNTFNMHQKRKTNIFLYDLDFNIKIIILIFVPIFIRSYQMIVLIDRSCTIIYVRVES